MKKSRKYGKRLLVGILCAAMLFTNSATTGILVQATEANPMGNETPTTEISDAEAGPKDETEPEKEGESTDSEETSEEAGDTSDESAGNQESSDGETDKSETEKPGGGDQSGEMGDAEGEDGKEDDTSHGENNSEDDATEKSPNEEEIADGENNTEGEEISEQPTEKSSNEDEAELDELLSVSAEERLALMSAEGDIASGTSNDIAWVIDKNGKLTVTGTGDWIHPSFPWWSERVSIKTAEINVTGMKNASNMFNGCLNLSSINLSNFETSSVTDMSDMFFNCESLTSLDLSHFKTDNVTDMGWMFAYCSGLISLDLNHFETSNVTNMRYMFSHCSSFKSLDLSHFNTANVTNMESIFSGCDELINIKIDHFDTSNVTDMSYMFADCKNLMNLDLSHFNTNNVTNMEWMFSNCDKLITLNLSHLDTSNVTDMNQMFYGCGSLTSLDLSSFDTSKVTNMEGMFCSCICLSSLDIRHFDTHNVKNMNYMFAVCWSLSTLDLSHFVTDNVTNMRDMFGNCTGLISLNMSCFNASNVLDMSNLLYNCDSLSLIYTPLNVISYCVLPASSSDTWYRSDGSTVTELPKNLSYSVALGKNYIPEEQTLSGISNHVMWEIDKEGTLTLSGLGDWLKNENGMPPWAAHSNRIKKTVVSLTDITDTSNMFSGCANMKSANLCGLDMSLTVDAAGMFDGCNSLTLIYTPVKLSCPVPLPTQYDSDVWHQSNGTVLTSLPQNFDYSIAIGKNYIPEEIPQSITSCTGGSINGKGVSYGQVCLVYQGEPVRNRDVRWTFDGYDGTFTGKTDDKGYFSLESPSLSYRPEGESNYALKANVSYFTGKQWLSAPEKYSMGVKVEPLTVSQKWQLKTTKSLELGLSAGGGVEIGPVEVEGTLGEVGVAASSGGTLDLSHEYENGMRKLTLMQTLSNNVALKSSIGPAAAAELGGTKAKVKLMGVKGSADVENSFSYGLEIDHYDPANLNQCLQVGKFIATTQMYNSNNVFLKNAMLLWGFDQYDIQGSGVKGTLASGVSASGIEISDANGENVGFSANLASVDYKRLYTTGFTNNGYRHTSQYKVELVSDVKEGLLNFGLKDSRPNIEKFSLVSIGERPKNTGINLTTNQNGDLTKVEYIDKTYTSWGIPFYTAANTNQISFSVSNEEALQRLNSTQRLRKILASNNEYFFPESYITDTWEDIHQNADTMDFNVSSKETSMIDVPLSFGLSLGAKVKVGVDLSGSAESSYITQKGTTKDDSLYVTAQMQNTEEDIKNAKMSESEFFTAPLKAAGDKIGEFLVETTGKVIDGVKEAGAWVGDKLQEGSDWIIHIVSFKKEKTRTAVVPQSFEIDTYKSVSFNANETPGSSMTVGDPYLVYVTDTAENEIADFAAHPLTLKLSYNADTLMAAGVTEDQASALAIYMYSEDKCGYLNLGGQVDTETRQVMTDITKPGEYILAVDTLAPSIYDIYVSDTSSRPTIMAFLSELSGFTEFSMKIDGVEYVNMTSLEKYLDQSSGSFFYKVEQPLALGEHTLSFTATDGRGNTTAQPIIFTFTVEQAAENSPSETGDVLPEDMPENGKIPDDLWVASIPNSVYTGNAIKPEPHVYDSNVRLKTGKDYTITYKNNIKANDASNAKTAPTITVTGKGNYSGKETVTFKILPITLTETNTTISDMTKVHNKKTQKPIPSITINGRKLKHKTDFTVSYPDSTLGAYQAVGTYRIVVSGKGNYTGEQTLTFAITDKTPISKVTVVKIPNQAYSGEKITPAPVVKYKKSTLVEHVDYELEYRDNVEIGKATLILRGKGDYVGSKTVSFRITGGSLKKAKVTGLISPVVYTGTEIRQNAVLTIKVNGTDVTLQSGKDYTVSYQNNVKTGTAKIIYKGINGYTGTIQKKYKITPYDILSDEVGNIRHTDNIVCAYLKGGSRPEPDIYFKDTLLKKDVDYTLRYKNNNAVGGSKTPTVIVKGKGSFKNKFEIPFTIKPQDLSNMTLAPCDKVYKPKANIYKITPKLLDANGKALSAGKDFDKNSIAYTYEKNVTLEDGTVRKAGDTVGNTDIIPADTPIRITLTCGSGNLYEGTFTGTYRIVAADIKSARVTIPAQIYTGSEIRPDKTQMTVKVSKVELSAEDYDILSYSNNVKKGKASVTIKGKGNYGGTKTVKFTIRAKGFLWWWR